MKGWLHRSAKGILGAGLAFGLAGVITTTLGYCGNSLSACLTAHPSEAPPTQFAGSIMVVSGILLTSLGVYLMRVKH